MSYAPCAPPTQGLPQVGAVRTRHADPYDGVWRHCLGGGALRPSGGVYASPSRSAAVAASTGTVTGCGAPATAQSGSLSPLPVTVQTIFCPGSTLP